MINFSIKPNRPGQNFIKVGVFNTRRPAPGTIEAVAVKLLPPDGQDEFQIDMPLTEQDVTGNYQVSTQAIRSSGDWKVAVQVKRSGMEDATLEIPWQVAPPVGVIADQPAEPADRPLSLWFTTTSVLLLVLLSGLWLATIVRPELFHRLDNQPNLMSK